MGTPFGTQLGTRFGTKLGTQFPGDGGAAPAPSFSGLIDTIIAAGDPAPDLAFCDFTRLYSAYTGALLTIERVTGGATQAIGYDASGNLDTAAIATFCGASLGRVVTRHDQSGNARDETQTTATERPQIWNGSAVTVAGVAGRPACTYNRAAGQSLGRAGYLSGASAFTIFYGGLASVTGNKTWSVHSPLRYGSWAATPVAYIGAGSQFRRFTAVTPITTLSSYISTFPGGTLSNVIAMEQNGTSLAQDSVLGSVAVSFATTDVRTGADTDGGASLAIDGVVPWVLQWGVQLSAASLTALRAFGAANI
jgi:hypothetical protein